MPEWLDKDYLLDHYDNIWFEIDLDSIGHNRVADSSVDCKLILIQFYTK